MKKYIINTGWKLKPVIIPYIAYISKDSSNPEILELTVDSPLTIQVAINEPRFCIGFTNDDGKHVPCPTAQIIPPNKIQCQTCSLNEFYICRSYCTGDFCQPSSEKSREHCWKTSAFVYITHIGGKLKVGSTTSPLRRWIDQGSDASIIIAEGVGLEPRALEYALSSVLSLKMAIRINQKFKQLGANIDKKKITNEIESAIEQIYRSDIKSNILIPIKDLESIIFLDKYYGKVPQLNARPLMKHLKNKGLLISGKIIGVKGSILVLKNNETFYAMNLNSIIGMHIDLFDDIVDIKGQKSLFDFV